MNFKNIKNWNLDIEKEITEKWKKSKQFNFNPKTKKKIYSIDTPPPYINAPIHIGHATTYVYQDFFARYWRMKNFEVLFPLGLDRNGLPIEVGAEKKFNVSPFTMGREKFLGYCKKLLRETSLESTNTFARLGISFSNYKKTDEIGSVYFTDDPKYRALTQSTFIDLFKKGLVYEDSRINNWDPVLKTTLADSEIERKEEKTNLNYIKFKLIGSDENIIIATTRPELLCTSCLIIYNPKDKRYKHLKGKKAITPIFGTKVDIIEHKEANPNFGTGIVFMSSSGGDQDAVRFIRKMGIKPVSAVGLNGRMNEHGGILKGLKTKDARKKIIEEIKKRGLMEKQEELMHSVPISERSKAEIEFIEMPEYYVKQLEIKNKIKKLAKKMNFFPEASRKILDAWIDSISIDWPVSRRRFYATEVPLWHYKDSDGKTVYAVPPKGKYYHPWQEKVPKDSEIYKNNKKIGTLKDFKDKKWKGDERVLDTWFDSSISALYILGYHSNKEFFKKAYPASLRPQGKEIVRTWLYYSLLRCYYQTGKMPFKNVWIHNHILDEKGRKMSKSLGNIIDPQDIIKEHGSEAFRLWVVKEGDLSKQDLSCSKERIKAELKTLNKLLNLSKFVMLFKKPSKKPKLTDLDNLFIDYVEELTENVDKSYESYDFHNPSLKLRNFLWEVFASHYVEIVKSRAYNPKKKFNEEESNSAKYTLHFLLERLIILLYPIIPQITTVIAKEKAINLLEIKFPKIEKRKSDLKLIEKIMNFNSEVWKQKKEKGMGLKSEISNIKISKELEKFKKDLIGAHNIV